MKNIHIETHPSRVVFDPVSSSFVVTWAKCDRPENERVLAHKNPAVWIPSVSSIAELYDRGKIKGVQIIYAARSIGRALEAGDRHLLDTDAAKCAAEMVSRLEACRRDEKTQSACRDIGQSIRNLLDEIARVKFMGLSEGDLGNEAVDILDRAFVKCFHIHGFCGWPMPSKRRRMLYEIKSRDRSEVVYAAVALLFDTGPCPILSMKNRRALRIKAVDESHIDSGMTPDSVHKFFSYIVSVMSEMKKAGDIDVPFCVTQQEMSDMVTSSSY